MCGHDAGELYDVATSLSDDGFVKNLKYIPHMSRGTLSIHSNYLTLWANYGALCICLLMNPILSEKLTETEESIFSPCVRLRHDCFSRTLEAWQLLSSNLNITTEERVALVNHSLEGYYKVMMKGFVICVITSIVVQHYQDYCTDVNGTYDCQEDMSVCETFLHQHCFLHAWKKVQSEVSTHRVKIVDCN